MHGELQDATSRPGKRCLHIPGYRLDRDTVPWFCVAVWQMIARSTLFAVRRQRLGGLWRALQAKQTGHRTHGRPLVALLLRRTGGRSSCYDSDLRSWATCVRLTRERGGPRKHDTCAMDYLRTGTCLAWTAFLMKVKSTMTAAGTMTAGHRDTYTP